MTCFWVKRHCLPLNYHKIKYIPWSLNPSAILAAPRLGLELEAGISSEQAELIDEALGRFGALVIREQPLSPERLVSLARLLGPVQPHVQRAYQHPDVPEVVFMTNQKSDGSFDEAGARRGAVEDVNRGWHSDLSYDPVPAKATFLHALDVPSSGGNACFYVTALISDYPMP